MEKLQIFKMKNVRAYIGKNGIAFLSLEDVARGLGFTQVKNNKEYIRWETIEKYLSEFSQRVGKDDFIPENIFYKLCMKANNEVARKFQDLVCDEILPSIRKNGGYIATNENDSDEEIMAKALLVAQRTIQNKNEKIKELQNKVEEQKPRVLFAKAVEAAKTTILIGDLAKIIKQNGVDMGQKRLFAWLRDNGYLIKRQGSDYNMPTQKSMELGLFEIKETAVTHSDGHITVSKTPKVTGKGQTYFINKLLRKVG